MYYLELATVQHYEKSYKKSNLNFEKAENLIEELYTRSLTRQTASLFTSENVKPYRPEDYEKVLINYYRAFNYFFLDDLEDAVVEARRVDENLEKLNEKYKNKNAYRDDAFMEFVSGIFHEINGEYNDALISYRRSFTTFRQEYSEYFGIHVPDFVLRSIKRTSLKTGIELYDESIDSIKINPDYGIFITILEYGLIPEKKEAYTDLWINTSGDRTKIIRVAIPYFPDTTINLPNVSGKLGKISLDFQEVEPIYKIARKDLEDKKTRIIAKALLRAGVKYGAEKKIEDELKKKSENLSDVLGSLLNIVNVFTERADTRQWSTLPATILVCYKEIPPGNYPLTMIVNGDSILIDTIRINSGEINLIKIRKF